MLKKREVIKHSAAIHITNRVSILQRRAWNILLAQAFDDLIEKEEHQVEIKDLIDELKFDSKNEDYIKGMLRSLTTTGVEWNVFEKDREQEWAITTLLAQAHIKKGMRIGDLAGDTGAELDSKGPNYFCKGGNPENKDHHADNFENDMCQGDPLGLPGGADGG